MSDIRTSMRKGPALRQWFLHFDPKLVPPERFAPSRAHEDNHGLTFMYPPLWCTTCEAMVREQSQGSQIWTCDCGVEGDQEVLEEIVRGHIQGLRLFIEVFCPRSPPPVQPWWKRWFPWVR